MGGGARVLIASRSKGSSRGETQGALLASAKKARDVLLAGAPLAQLPSSLYCSLLAYPSPFHWHLSQGNGGNLPDIARHRHLPPASTCPDLGLHKGSRSS